MVKTGYFYEMELSNLGHFVLKCFGVWLAVTGTSYFLFIRRWAMAEIRAVPRFRKILFFLIAIPTTWFTWGMAVFAVDEEQELQNNPHPAFIVRRHPLPL